MSDSETLTGKDAYLVLVDLDVALDGDLCALEHARLLKRDLRRRLHCARLRVLERHLQLAKVFEPHLAEDDVVHARARIREGHVLVGLLQVYVRATACVDIEGVTLAKIRGNRE